MSTPPAAQPISETTVWGVAKQAQASEAAKRVRIIGLNGCVVDICTGDRLRRYLGAPNKEIIRSHQGKSSPSSCSRPAMTAGIQENNTATPFGLRERSTTNTNTAGSTDATCALGLGTHTVQAVIPSDSADAPSPMKLSSQPWRVRGRDSPTRSTPSGDNQEG
jgi:hypothetical protein